MALKINGVGQPINNFEYSIGPTNNASAFLTIKYSQKNRYGIVVTKIRVYEFRTDRTHPQLASIIQQVNVLLSMAQNQRIVIKENKIRNYIDILEGVNFYQYSGWSI